jgi:glycosyltransferase involved in cell wall biosynthesis
VRRRVGQFVFYAANPSISNRDLVADGDVLLVPSAAQGERMRARLGREPEVFPSPVAGDRVPAPESCIAAEPGAAIRHGFVTLLNPAPEKGGLLGLALARAAAREAPDLGFLFVESRWTRAAWARHGARTGLSNVWWLPVQRDVRPIYRRTAILLFPSVWFEPSGRSVAEAMLAGVPVIASDRGGLPEQLGGGGSVLPVPDMPERGGRLRIDPETVAAWLGEISRLRADPATYAAARERALAASARFDPARRGDEIAARFRAMLR